MNRTTKIKITELNPHVICVLCGGYYINATTITECLHSFCRTCITRYLETSKYCPVCDVMVHKTRPLNYIRSDKTLQDLVYKLVPALYKSEMKRRREYYAAVDTPGVSQLPSEDRGDEFYDRIIYTEDEKMSLSLELCAHGIPFKTPTNVHGHTGPDNIRIKDVRYLQCPAAFSVGNLKKFIRMKFDLKLKFEIDIFHTAEPLPDYYSLMDIAYIYTWTRRCPLRLYYTVFQRNLPPKVPGYISRDQSYNVDSSNTTALGKHSIAEDKHINKKQKLLDGPDDISPDIAFDKSKPYKSERRKGIGTPKKRVKKALMETDDSVKEAMSESEEQLAKLTLDCSGDRRIGASVEDSVISVDATAESSNTLDACDTHVVAKASTFEIHKEITKRKGSGKQGNKVKRDWKCDPEILTTITIETNSHVDSGESEISGAIQSNKDNESASKQSSTQVSPVSLSLFQPLNAVVTESTAEMPKSGLASDADKLRDEQNDKLYEFQSEESTPVDAKKSRGRPKGSKNKLSTEKICVKNKTNGTKTNKVMETDCIASKKHPGLKSPKSQKCPKKPDAKLETLEKNTSPKTKKNTGANKVLLKDKRIKRKYVRKVKAESVDESGREIKRSKKDPADNTEKDGSEAEHKVYENGNHEVEIKCVNSVNNVIAEIIKDHPGISSDKELPLEPSEDAKESLLCEDNTEEKCGENDQEKQMTVNLSSLPEPITPLYGETPKMNESNQGLPCSPNMESLDNSGRLVIDTSENNGDLDGAITSEISDKTSKCATNQTNGAINENMNMKNGDSISKHAFSKEMFRNGYDTFEVNQNIANTLRNNSEIPNAHTDQFRQSMNGLSPPNALTLISGFSPPPYTAHVHMGHLIGNGYQIHDQNFDQPLDLTNNGAREEYTKGKIFKTKMLKKTYPKQDSMQCFKTKSTCTTNPFLH